MNLLLVGAAASVLFFGGAIVERKLQEKAKKDEIKRRNDRAAFILQGLAMKYRTKGISLKPRDDVSTSSTYTEIAEELQSRADILKEEIE